MNTLKTQAARLLVVCGMLLLLPMSVDALAATAYYDLDGAIRTGDFGVYHARISTWLGRKVAASRISEAGLKALLKDPIFLNTLDQRQLMSKVGLNNMGKFAKADPANKVFLTWLLKNPQAMDLYLEGATPAKIPAREDNSWSLSVGGLDIWKRIYYADPDSRQGIYLRLAIATALRPPGTGSPGSGQQKTPSDPVVRYKYYKTAHANKELFPSFDNLTVWDMQFVVCSGASEADLTWGREMVNTWNPLFKINEKVVDTTSCVWRRNSPVPHVDYRAVLDGGGKCGPRSSWSVFICQAWGIPAIGVGQPAHACVAYKSLDGSWQVAYGKGWNASKLEGMSGPEFVEGVEARAFTHVFSQVEHLRWLASSLSSKEQSAAIMQVASAISKATPAKKRDLEASEKANEMNANPEEAAATKATKTQSAAKPETKPEPPVAVAPGVIHVEGTRFFQNGGITVWGGEPRVAVLDSYPGGKQLHFPQGMASAWVGYKINVPETGVYELTTKIASINSGQALYARSFGAMLPVKKATASAVYMNQTKDMGPQMACDNDPGTRWAVNMGVDQAWIEIDLGKPTTISMVMIDERAYGKVSKFVLEYTTIGIGYAKDFSPVTAQYVRLRTIDCSGNTGGPTIWEFNVGTVQDGQSWIGLPWTAGLWEVTKPVDIRLVKGSQTIWLFAPYQRGVSLKWFELKRKAVGGSSSGMSPSLQVKTQ
jgi:hypothetical protein